MSAVRLAFVAVLVAIIGTAGLSYRSTTRLVEATARVTAAHETLAALSSLWAAVQDAETGQRGYLLTGERAYLDPYRAARATLGLHVRRLEVTAQGADQRTRLAELQPEIDAKLRELRRTIRLRKRGEVAAALRFVRTGTGKAHMDRIRTLVDAMVAGEETQIRRRAASLHQAALTAAATFTLAAVLSIVLVGALYGLLKRRERERENATLALRERERRLTELADAMPQMVWTARPDGAIDYYNQRWLEYAGQTLEESIGWGWEPIVHPDDLPRLLATWQAARARGEPAVVEVRLRRARDGAHRWHLIRAEAVRDLAGGVVRWVGTSTDIDDRRRTEETLRISEERFRVSVGHAPLVVYQCDRNLRYTWVANAPDDVGARLLGRRIDEVLPAEERDALAETTALHAATVATGHGCRREVTWTRAGETRHYDLTLEPLRDVDGTVVGLTGAAMDITQRKRGEDDLRRSRDVIETVHRVGQAVAAELDLEQVVQGVTDAAMHLSGARFGAFFYNRLDEQGQAYMLYALSGAPRAAFASFPMPRNTAIFAPTFHGEGVVRLDDVTTDPRYGRSEPFRGMPPGHLPVASYLAVPVIARSGEVLGGLFMGHPEPARFTEHHERLVVGLAAQAAVAIDNARLYDAERRARTGAEEAARRTAFLAEAGVALGRSLDYGATLQTVADVVVPKLGDVCLVDVVERDGSFRRAGAARLDADRDDAVRTLLGRTALPADPAHPLRRVLETGRSLLVPEVPAAAGVGTGPAAPEDVIQALGVRSYMLVPLATRGARGVLGVAAVQPGRYGPADLALLEDLARRAALAMDNARLFNDAQEANRMKDEFITTVSHELRTPLAAMMNWIAVLRQGKVSGDRITRALDVLQRSGEAQAKLIEDLLDVSRAVTGRLRLDARPIDLAHVVAEALDVIRPAAERKGIRIEHEGDVSPGVLTGDPVRLQQVAWNLLANAVKFTPAGGRVTVRLERRGDEARLVVADTGDGIAPEFLPHVFERFRQAEKADTRRHGGLGLGLAIVKHLVEAHGGRVEAHSDGPGLGSEFVVRLPLSASVAPAVGAGTPDAATG